MSARDDVDSLAPQAEVRISSQALREDAAADLAAVRVLEDVEACGTVALTFVAWDAATMKPKWIDDPLFEEGHPVDVSLGYADRLQAVFSGEITGLEPDFDDGRPPTIVVRAHDRRHRLMRACRTRSFLQSSESQIARQIAGEAGLSPDVEDSGAVLPYVLQHNQTDLEFLSARARRIGFDVWVRDQTLHFRSPAIGSEPALTLTQGLDLLSFRARLSTLRQVTELEVRGWDPARKQEVVGRGASGDAPAAMSSSQGAETGPASTRRAFERTASARVTMPVQSQEEADGLARRGFADMALGFVQADGIAIGDPRLRAGIVVKIDGCGERFSGPYYVTAVEHEFSHRRGYRTHFRARRNAR